MSLLTQCDEPLRKQKRRRMIQQDFNEKQGIVPRTVQKGVRDVLEATLVAEEQGGISG